MMDRMRTGAKASPKSLVTAKDVRKLSKCHQKLLDGKNSGPEGAKYQSVVKEIGERIAGKGLTPEKVKELSVAIIPKITMVNDRKKELANCFSPKGIADNILEGNFDFKKYLEGFAGSIGGLFFVVVGIDRNNDATFWGGVILSAYSLWHQVDVGQKIRAFMGAWTVAATAIENQIRQIVEEKQ